MKKINMFVFVGLAGLLFSLHSSAETISGIVKVDAKIQKKLPAKGVLFVFARASNTPGRGFPLAVKRIENPKFPEKFELSQKDAMVAGTKFEGPIKVVARFSPSGDVMAKKGAFEGTVGNDNSIVVGKSKDVTVTIDTEL